MKKTRVAINGFGRIGRLTYRNLIKRSDIDIVAVNDLSNIKTIAHLLKYDSTQGSFEHEVKVLADSIIVDGDSFKVLAVRNPEELPWEELKIDVVLESTGIFRRKDQAEMHLKAGAKRVVLSAPPKSDGINMYVIGVNDDKMSADELIISNASCTTNCLAVICKVLDENFKIDKGFLNTIHAYTADQNIQDAPHSDLRRARAAAVSIIPTTTGAAKSVERILPSLKKKIQGLAVRVPVATGSITDFTVLLENEVSKEEINNAFKKASENELKGVLEYLKDELVSSDIVGNPHSSIFDPFLTFTNGKMVKINSWYDNEYGYASRSAELISKVGQFIK